MAKAKPKRRQRRRGDLPAGFVWRGGRPRWEPSPARRKAGWKGVDLKDERGDWLALGAAVARAEAIAKAVAAHAAGAPVAVEFLHFAPKGAAAGGWTPGQEGPRSIGAMLDGFCADPKPRTRVLSEKTRADYRSKLNRLLGLIAETQGASLEALRTVDIALLLAPPFGSEAPFLLEVAYERLRLEAGEHMAHNTVAVASAWLDWVMRRTRALSSNPAKMVARETPDGRIVVFDWAEIVALAQAAEELGWPSVADAIILAIDLSWSQQDLLAIELRQISEDGHVAHRRIKTGVAGVTKLLALGRARVAEILQRRAGATVQPTRLIICEDTGKPWRADHFRHVFAAIRGYASAELPSLADKQFRDLRDTAVTYAHEAQLEVAEICTRTLHAPERATAVLAKHYGALRQDLGDAAAAKLEAHFAARGYTIGAGGGKA